MSGLPPADPTENAPALSGVIPFYYYDDLPAAVRWYAEILGFRTIWNGGWTVVMELVPGVRLGLVDGSHGLERPVPGPHKGALIALETEELEAWYARLERIVEAGSLEPIVPGANGQTEMFLLRDPGGYLVEFFRWRVPVRTIPLPSSAS